MTASILDRLNARIAVEPSLNELDTLFIDLGDARDAIVAATAENAELQSKLAAAPGASTALPQENIIEAVAFLTDAKERLAVNSASSAGDSIDRAIRLLG